MILTYAKRRRKSCLAPIGTKRRVRVNMERRFEKKVEVNGEIALHEGYIYHGYLQIACVDLQKPFHAAKRYITWDPTQSTATRPLALQQNSVWYTYGWDLTKNICELYNNTGYILNLYTYSPYGTVTADGDVTQPIQWSSEYHDTELALIYYNFRYYNPTDGRWTRRDILGEDAGNNLYVYVYNASTNTIDYIGLKQIKCTVTIVWGHGGDVDQYIEDNYQNYDPTTTAFGPFGCQVAPAPSGYAIPGFPNLQNSNLGDKNRGQENNKKNNAGLNPNGGKSPQDRRQGFANAFKQALKSALQEAENICKNSCCKSVDVILKRIGARSGKDGTNELRRRLKDTNSSYKHLTSYEKRK